MIIIKKYKDISELFPICSITDESFIIKQKENKSENVIYEVIPTSILNYTKDRSFKIISQFTEFLKGIECDYKIIIRSCKFNKQEYINIYTNGANEKIKKLIFYKDYINDLSNKIHKEDMYFNKIYFCLNRESKNIQETLKNMNTIGVFFKKLKREEIKSVLKSSINKI
ncbi:unknown [Clostridium sp. CAG:1219]|nr:unknown [Clostridium sp. CAG:1219]